MTTEEKRERLREKFKTNTEFDEELFNEISDNGIKELFDEITHYNKYIKHRDSFKNGGRRPQNNPNTEFGKWFAEKYGSSKEHYSLYAKLRKQYKKGILNINE
jgi:adenine specific DNA methylase Mod